MMKAIYICILVLLIGGCTQSDYKSTRSELDYITVGDKQYINAWELALVDTIGMSEIGQVEQGSIIPEGTPVYEITGYPEQNVVVVKAKRKNTSLVTNISGYLVYVLHGKDGELLSYDSKSTI